MSLNVCLITGNLTAPPELKELKTGATVATLRIAVNEHFTNREGKPVERAVFIDVVTWEKLAERCHEYLDKGSRVTVEGSLQQDTWEDRDGNPRSAIRIRADQVHFLNRTKSENGQPPRGSAPPRSDREERDPDRRSNSRRMAKSR